MPTKDPNKTSHIKDLVLLFSIPVGIAICIAAIVYIPSLLANPKYDFVYSVCSSYRCDSDFNVDGSGHVSQYGVDSDRYADTATLHYYSVKDDSTRTIGVEEAKGYQLDTSSKSPDGYTLSKEGSNSGFLFWSNYESGWYLKDGLKKKKIELSNNDSYYSRDVKFLGWVNK